MSANASMLMTYPERFSQLDWVLEGPGLKSGLRGTARCFSRGITELRVQQSVAKEYRAEI